MEVKKRLFGERRIRFLFGDPLECFILIGDFQLGLGGRLDFLSVYDLFHFEERKGVSFSYVK